MICNNTLHKALALKKYESSVPIINIVENVGIHAKSQ
jgi:aspartate/glutamate racemase